LRIRTCSGPGELFFQGDANDQTTGLKGPFVKDSGDNLISFLSTKEGGFSAVWGTGSPLIRYVGRVTIFGFLWRWNTH